ncbi:WXG100 family type VII secretion target [Micromonospora fulviviridis]|uniref:Uncharacterized protein n=1 Tax=Micromonospora fulviviridis TaxID=47860 RepID=A0ABV2VHE3_9ACTN
MSIAAGPHPGGRGPSGRLAGLPRSPAGTVGPPAGAPAGRPAGRPRPPTGPRQRAQGPPGGPRQRAAEEPIGYAQLWRADPGAWAAAGAAWRGLTGPVRRRADGLTARIGALRPGWSGAASATARGRIGELRTELTDLLPALIEVDQVLAEFAARVGAAKARLGTAVAQADAGGLLVDRAGAVRPDPARPRPAPWSARPWRRRPPRSTARWRWPARRTGRRPAGWRSWRRRRRPAG